jgi:non-ribosomal peptide synthetase component F
MNKGFSRNISTRKEKPKSAKVLPELDAIVKLHLAGDLYYLEAHLNLGVALKQQHRIEEAIAAYYRTLDSRVRSAGRRHNIQQFLVL